LDFANHPYLCKGLSEYKRRSLDKEAQALYKKLQTKGLLLKNIVRSVKKSYAQNALNGICGVRYLDLIM
jgi:hypothetical protein